MEPGLRARFRERVLGVLAARGWTLVRDEEAFLEEVMLEVEARLTSARRPPEKIVEDATINRYGHLWYAACCERGTPRQAQALRELHRHLYRIAFYQANGDPQLAEESAQEALINVWRHLDQVRDPGSFVRYATTVVSHQLQALRHQPQRSSEVEGVDLARSGDKEEGDFLDRQSDLPPRGEASLPSDMRARIEQAIRRCLKNTQEQAVIIQLFLDDRTIKEVADVLTITQAYVSVLKHRALRRLRACETFLEAIEELL